ncbi:hypothetical protein VTJ49DRAFT_1037 [Mycothermus thermophilus]|uniref:Uncharacterized protein n=1 Tax=Humicola insolens TaxID=85995 RepID=A0ABR3VDW6_HUMIN
MEAPSCSDNEYHGHEDPVNFELDDVIAEYGRLIYHQGDEAWVSAALAAANNNDILNYHEQYDASRGLQAQARDLVEGLINSGVSWGRLWAEACRKWAGTEDAEEKGWYDALMEEMVIRVRGAALAGLSAI